MVYRNKENEKRYKAEYYKLNKDKIKKRSQEYYETNKDRVRVVNKKYRENNKERLREYGKRYAEINKERLKEVRRKYSQRPEIKEKRRANNMRKERALKLSVVKKMGGRCACCGLNEWWNLTIDHILPLKGKTRQRNEKIYSDIHNGRIDLTQYQLLCFGCNLSKGIHEKCHIEHENSTQYLNIFPTPKILCHYI